MDSVKMCGACDVKAANPLYANELCDACKERLKQVIKRSDAALKGWETRRKKEGSMKKLTLEQKAELYDYQREAAEQQMITHAECVRCGQDVDLTAAKPRERDAVICAECIAASDGEYFCGDPECDGSGDHTGCDADYMM
jgi:hypothetical protein